MNPFYHHYTEKLVWRNSCSQFPDWLSALWSYPPGRSNLELAGRGSLKGEKKFSTYGKSDHYTTFWDLRDLLQSDDSAVKGVFFLLSLSLLSLSNPPTVWICLVNIHQSIRPPCFVTGESPPPPQLQLVGPRTVTNYFFFLWQKQSAEAWWWFYQSLPANILRDRSATWRRKWIWPSL